MRKGRQIILDRVRSRVLPDRAAPQIDWDRLVRYDDLKAQFCDSAEFVGAKVHHVDSVATIRRTLEESAEYDSGKVIASTVEGLEGNFSASQVQSPQEYQSLDWMLIRGRFGVAENGAIWVPADEVDDRVQVFITQHLVIVLEAADLEPHMHAAYQRLGRFEGYGVFVSGPSKTADIEQSLVLGAHGCRTLDIFLIGRCK